MASFKDLSNGRTSEVRIVCNRKTILVIFLCETAEEEREEAKAVGKMIYRGITAQAPLWYMTRAFSQNVDPWSHARCVIHEKTYRSPECTVRRFGNKFVKFFVDKEEGRREALIHQYMHIKYPNNVVPYVAFGPSNRFRSLCPGFYFSALEFPVALVSEQVLEI